MHKSPGTMQRVDFRTVDLGVGQCYAPRMAARLALHKTYRLTLIPG